jgi:hypothetical protein
MAWSVSFACSKLSETALNELRDKYGVVVRYGRWLVEGYPRVFLIDVESVSQRAPRLRCFVSSRSHTFARACVDAPQSRRMAARFVSKLGKVRDQDRFLKPARVFRCFVERVLCL